MSNLLPPSSPQIVRTAPSRAVWPGAALGLLELIVVATLSMYLVDQVTVATLGALGLPGLLAHPAGIALVMTVDISAGTAVWMLHRRRPTRSIVAVIVGVAAALFAPVLPFALGLMSASTAVLVGHLLVIPALALVVGLLPADLSSGRGRPAHSAAASSSVRSALDRVADRWPTVLALLLTFGKIIDPGITPAWVLIVLGGEYLIIGAARRQFRDRRLLAVHVAGALAYAALAVLAMFVDHMTAGILIGVGWLLHAGWDIALHRRNVVVWRWFAEACAVFDIVVGLSAIAAVVLMAAA